LGSHRELPLLILILNHLQQDQWDFAWDKASRIQEAQQLLEGHLQPAGLREATALILRRISELAENAVLEERAQLEALVDGAPGVGQRRQRSQLVFLNLSQATRLVSTPC